MCHRHTLHKRDGQHAATDSQCTKVRPKHQGYGRCHLTLLTSVGACVVATEQRRSGIAFSPTHLPAQSRAGFSCQSWCFVQTGQHDNNSNDRNHLQNCFIYLFFFSLAKERPQITEEEGITVATGAHHQGAIKMLWLDTLGGLLCHQSFQPMAKTVKLFTTSVIKTSHKRVLQVWLMIVPWFKFKNSGQQGWWSTLRRQNPDHGKKNIIYLQNLSTLRHQSPCFAQHQWGYIRDTPFGWTLKI